MHQRDSDDHDDQKLIQSADVRIHYWNLADATDSVWISEFDLKTRWIVFYSALVVFNPNVLISLQDKIEAMYGEHKDKSN